MRNLFLIIFLTAPLLCNSITKGNPAFAEISTNIQNAYSPDMLIDYSIQAGKMNDNQSVDLLNQILEKCKQLGAMYSSGKVDERINVAQAYAMFYLAKLLKKNHLAKKIIEENFTLSRAVCTALHKAKYRDLHSLIEDKIAMLFSKYNSFIEDAELADEVARQHPGVKFILKSYKINKIVEPKLLEAMLDFAYFVGTVRSAKYFDLCKKTLTHQGEIFWCKPIYRSVLRMRTSDYNKFRFFKKELISKRNTEFDKCSWDFARPNTIIFSIKDISAEAYLIFAIWNLNKIDVKQKIKLIIPSLNSTSFSARAMAVDCLKGNSNTISFIEKNINKNDKNLKNFFDFLRDD